MDSTGTIVAAVIAGTALFLGFLAWKLVWLLRKAGEPPPGENNDAATEGTAGAGATGAPDADGGTKA